MSCRNPAQSAEWRRRRVEGRHQDPHQEQVQQEGDMYDATKEDKQHGLRQEGRREGVQGRMKVNRRSADIVVIDRSGGDAGTRGTSRARRRDSV